MGKTTHYYAKRGEHVVVHRPKKDGCGTICGIIMIILILCFLFG